jgi:WD40 repeat protein
MLQVVLFDKATGVEVGQLKGDSVFVTGAILAIASAGTDNHVLTGGEDGVVRLWDSVEFQLRGTFEGHAAAVTSLSDVQNDTFISGSADGSCRMWSVSTGEFVRAFDGHDDAVMCLSARDNYFVSGSADGTLRIWRKNTGECAAIMRPHGVPVEYTDDDERKGGQMGVTEV